MSNKLTYKEIFWCILSGILTALAFSTTYTGWLVWFSLVPFFYILYSKELTPLRGFKSAFYFGISFYLALIHWLFYLHPLNWLGFSELESIVIITFGWIFISILQSFGIWIYGLVLGLYKPKNIQKILIPALFWLLLEWLQSFGELSLPWARLVISQYQYLPLLQISKITGSIFISGLIVAFNVSLVCLFLDKIQKEHLQKINLYSFFTVIVIILSSLIYGVIELNKPNSNNSSIPVAIVQGNFSQSEKWASMTIEDILNRYLKLSVQSLQHNPKLILWPESALPIFLTEYTPVYNLLRNFTKFYKIDILTGVFNRDTPQSMTYYNGATVINKEGNLVGWYYKRHLVPFGEYLPFRNIIEKVFGKLSWLNAIKHDLKAGNDPRPFNLPYIKVGTIICFESIYPDIVREAVNEGAEVIAIITNDGWYKDSIAPIQHNAHAVLRAIENGRYIVRAANTGLSCIIDYNGRILTQTKLLETTYITGYISPKRDITLYTKYGDWIIYLVIIVILFSIAKKYWGR